MGFRHIRLSRKQASTRAQRPLARTEELVVEEIGGEVLVYDQRSDRAHCLGSVAARVWRACDGRTTVAQAGAALGLDEPTVVRALAELGDCGLLESAPRAGLTRREATVRLARAGVAAASAPLIYSIVAPTPALAASQATCNAICQLLLCTDCAQAGCACCRGLALFNVCTADCSALNCNNSVFHPSCPGISTIGCAPS